MAAVGQAVVRARAAAVRVVAERAAVEMVVVVTGEAARAVETVAVE